MNSPMLNRAGDVGSKISVILLTYNHSNLILSTLKSIQEQSISGYEIIISDDCSTDGTWEQILAVAKIDPRIKAIQTPTNMGMPGNANFAVAHSDRPYIALLHHDDLYRNDLLEKWANVLNRFPDTTFVFNTYDAPNAAHYYGKPFTSERLDGQSFLLNHLFMNWGCPVRGTAMIRRISWDAIGGMREKFNLVADVDMWMRLSAIGSVGYVPEPIITPRHHRPDYYPDIYTGKTWHWSRQVFLYEIHAQNRLAYLQLNSLVGQMQWLRFRLKLSLETIKWLIYAVVRNKPAIITTSRDSVTAYDLLPLRLLRWTLQKMYPK